MLENCGDSLLLISMTEQLNSVAEIGLLGLRLCVSQGASLRGFLHAPVWPREKVTVRIHFQCRCRS